DLRRRKRRRYGSFEWVRRARRRNRSAGRRISACRRGWKTNRWRRTYRCGGNRKPSRETDWFPSAELLQGVDGHHIVGAAECGRADRGAAASLSWGLGSAGAEVGADAI